MPVPRNGPEQGAQDGPSFAAAPGTPLSLVILPEPEAKQGPSSDENSGLDPAENLEDIRRRREKQRADRELQDANHDGDLHGIRKAHTTYLLAITVAWLLLVWIVIMLQGFGQWFLLIFIPDPEKGQYYLHFNLSNTVMVAFITSTTATVLGLYGIAAYWLYGKKNESDDGKEKKQKKKTNGEKSKRKSKDDKNSEDKGEDKRESPEEQRIEERDGLDERAEDRESSGERAEEREDSEEREDNTKSGERDKEPA